MTTSMDEQTARAQLLQTRYGEALLRKAHVVGIGVGYVFRAGDSTGEIGLIVMVDQKLPTELLDPVDMIPNTIEGVRVDVREVGGISAL